MISDILEFYDKIFVSDPIIEFFIFLKFTIRLVLT